MILVPKNKQLLAFLKYWLVLLPIRYCD
jgi:hypothetical protein